MARNGDVSRGPSQAKASGTNLVEANSDTDNGDNELADEHSEGTVDEEGSSSELLDGVEGDRGGAHVDNREDHGDEKRVIDSATGIGRSDVVSRNRRPD